MYIILNDYLLKLQVEKSITMSKKHPPTPKSYKVWPTVIPLRYNVACGQHTDFCYFLKYTLFYIQKND